MFGLSFMLLLHAVFLESHILSNVHQVFYCELLQVQFLTTSWNISYVNCWSFELAMMIVAISGKSHF